MSKYAVGTSSKLVNFRHLLRHEMNSIVARVRRSFDHFIVKSMQVAHAQPLLHHIFVMNLVLGFSVEFLSADKKLHCQITNSGFGHSEIGSLCHFARTKRYHYVSFSHIEFNYWWLKKKPSAQNIPAVQYGAFVSIKLTLNREQVTIFRVIQQMKISLTLV